MKTKMKQINKMDNSVKLPWTIYKEVSVKPIKSIVCICSGQILALSIH